MKFDAKYIHELAAQMSFYPLCVFACRPGLPGNGPQKPILAKLILLANSFLKLILKLTIFVVL